MKKFELEKVKALKLAGQMRAAGLPGRFGHGATDGIDKREQRKLDAAAGLVPFACKLPNELVTRLRELAQAHEGGINVLMQELLTQALPKEKAVSEKS